VNKAFSNEADASREATGWRDDGSESGSIRVKPLEGRLISMPFRAGHITVENQGGTASFATGTLSDQSGVGGAMNISVPAGAFGTRIWVPFYGPTFGIRFRRDSSTGQDFTVSVDGVARRCEGLIPNLAAQGVSLTDGSANVIMFTDLGEGLHLAEVTVHARPSGANAILFYAYLVEERSGYVPFQRENFLVSTVVLTTGDTSVPFGASPNGALAVRKIDFCNTSASPVTVYVKNGSSVIWSTTLTAAGTAGSTASWDPGGLIPNSAAGLSMSASAGTSVNATTYGGL
jgi:hypothetical protein